MAKSMDDHSEEYLRRFSRFADLYGSDALEKLRTSTVCLVGLGGVGSWACEALARSGVGEFLLVDMDEICDTNANRQLHALDGNFGRAKVEAMAERIRAINPLAEVGTEKILVESTSAQMLFAKGTLDLVVDAIDGARNKAALVAACVSAGVKIVSAGGCAGKFNGMHVEVGDLADAQHDALLTRTRKELRTKYGFPKGEKKFGVPTIFSREEGKGVGTAAFVTGAFGLALAQEAVRILLSQE